MLGDWRQRHDREFGVLILPVGALLVMLVLAIALGTYAT